MSEEMDSTEVLNAAQLREGLRIFLEAYMKAKLLSNDAGTLRMHILHAKNSRDKSVKEKQINYLLLRLEERLLKKDEKLSMKELHVCEFLVEELQAYVKNSISRKK